MDTTSNDIAASYNLILENSTSSSLQHYWFSHRAGSETITYGRGDTLGVNAQSAAITITVNSGIDYWTVSFVDHSGKLYSTALLVQANISSKLTGEVTVTLDIVPAANNQYQVNIEYPGYPAGPLPMSLFGG